MDGEAIVDHRADGFLQERASRQSALDGGAGDDQKAGLFHPILIHPLLQVGQRLGAEGGEIQAAVTVTAHQIDHREVVLVPLEAAVGPLPGRSAKWRHRRSIRPTAGASMTLGAGRAGRGTPFAEAGETVDDEGGDGGLFHGGTGAAGDD